MLALYPDEQERLYQQIKGIMADLDGMPVRLINIRSQKTDILQTYEDMNRFTFSLA
jgi:hypothetical protein